MKWKLELGTPVILGNMLLVPIKGENAIEAIPLDEGYGRGVKITETGVIEKVILENPLDESIFVMDGEEFLGARQDRVAVTSALISSRCSVEYPVVCIEKERWEGEKELFEPGFSAFPKLRQTLTFERRSAFEVDQKKVWKQVETKLTTLKVNSQTMSMHDTFKEKEKEIKDYLYWEPEEETVGVMAFTSRGFLCCDIFGSAELFASLKDKVLSGYALDALEDRIKGKPFDIARHKPEAIMEEIYSTKKEKEHPSVGVGVEEIVKARKIKGKILKDSETLIHATFFPSR
ncbi:MAG: hypothetical protein GXO44_01515 [Deferribacteres bacterium]|nr:hypothetical protein [Deferribacteres bacterium]